MRHPERIGKSLLCMIKISISGGTKSSLCLYVLFSNMFGWLWHFLSQLMSPESIRLALTNKKLLAQIFWTEYIEFFGM